MNSDCCTSMIGLHTFTGCDSLIAFAGRDNSSTLKITRKDKKDMFAEQGSWWEIEGNLIAKLETFTCELCFPKSGTTERNELRYRLSPDVPYPVGHGLYKKRSSDNGEELQIEWMHGLPAPEAILNLMSCNSVSAWRVQMDSGVLTCVKSKLATTRLRQGVWYKWSSCVRWLWRR